MVYICVCGVEKLIHFGEQMHLCYTYTLIGGCKYLFTTLRRVVQTVVDKALI